MPKDFVVRAALSPLLAGLMAECLRATTSMGNQGTAAGPFRRALELIRNGAIGDVKEVHVWNSEGGADRKEPPGDAGPVPEGFVWDLWLGPAAFRPYHRAWLQRNAWRDFGTCQLGNWGSHSANLAFMALRVHDLWLNPQPGPGPAQGILHSVRAHGADRAAIEEVLRQSLLDFIAQGGGMFQDPMCTDDESGDWTIAQFGFIVGASMKPQTAFLMCLVLVLGSGALSEELPERLRRADSFLGIHFDFHAGPDCTEVGKNTTREMIERIIDLVHPDYLQIDCKGHRGLSSYPTEVGNPAPGFVGDPLRLWRQVTAERGVALYMHYSGVWDSEAILQHPDWAAINADGKPNENATSFWGPYADQLLIPQLRELAGDYRVDGVWIDGDCWASVPDYGAAAIQAFREATGIVDWPPDDVRQRRLRALPHHQFQFLQFHRDAFRSYVRHYINELRRTHPDFQLCSNWAFSDHMPEPVTLPLDFLSGDYSSDDSVNSARMSARYLARQGKPWDLMAWSFSQKARRKDGQEQAQKTAVQLQREAAVVLALGGGFQAYFKQRRDGSIYDEQMPVMAEVAAFCRARQAWCHHAEQVPQIALLFSTPAHYRRCSGLFSRDLSEINGTLQALVESQHPVEVLGEHHLTGRLPRYPLVIVPEWSYLDPGFQQQLRDYVREGGRLLLIGRDSARLFEQELGVKMDWAATGPGLLRYLAQGAETVAVHGPEQFSATSNVQELGKLHTTADPESSSFGPAAVSVEYGRGIMAATTFAFSRNYLTTRSPVLRGFLDQLVRELFPDPLVEVSGSHDVDVVLNRLNGKLSVHLINTAGPHRTEGILETIPPVGPLQIKVRVDAAPSRVTLQPENRSLPFRHRNGAVECELSELKIYDILVLE